MGTDKKMCKWFPLTNLISLNYRILSMPLCRVKLNVRALKLNEVKIGFVLRIATPSQPKKATMLGLSGRKGELSPWFSASPHSPLIVTIVATECYQTQCRRAPFFGLRL